MCKQTYDFNENWLFSQLPAHSWTQVTLPHTYNDTDGLNGKEKSYYRGPVCYRKTFDAGFRLHRGAFGPLSALRL